MSITFLKNFKKAARDAVFALSPMKEGVFISSRGSFARLCGRIAAGHTAGAAVTA